MAEKVAKTKKITTKDKILSAVVTNFVAVRKKVFMDVGGFDLDKEPNEIKKIIGVQLQTSGFYPGLKLIELIELFNGLYNRQVDPIELLRKVNLEDKAKSLYKSLSDG